MTPHKLRRVLVIELVVLLFGIHLTTTMRGNSIDIAAGAVLYVDDDNVSGPWNGTREYPFPYIQWGVNVASDGDTIYVLNGTYKGTVLVNKALTLKGDSNPIIDGLGGKGVDVTANNVTIEGFRITNSSYGIYCQDVSGFSIRNNTFSYDGYGLFWHIENNPTANYSVYDVAVRNNEFYMDTNNSALTAYINLNYENRGPYSVNIGNVSICNNAFYMDETAAKGIDMRSEGKIYVYNLRGGSISVGTLNISENKINGGSYGIEFFGSFDSLQDAQVNAGDIIINNNVLLDQSTKGMYIDYYDAVDWEGNMIGNYGDLVIQSNIITSKYNADAVYISDIGYWNYFYDNARLTVGDFRIQQNRIDVHLDGIYFNGYEAGYEMNEYSSFTMQSILLNNNTVHSGKDGIVVDLEYFGTYMYNNSLFEMGDIEVSHNIIDSTNYGICIRQLSEFGYRMYQNSSFAMENILINNNTIRSGSDGILLNGSRNHERFGYDVFDNASIKVGTIEFGGNSMISGNSGMNLTDLASSTIRNNTMYESFFGICLRNSSDNLVYHNSFINNTVQAIATDGHANAWDHGYPSGGNYWSDYSGTDLFSGPYQNLTGSDSIGDTQYIINSNNIDRYPLLTFSDTDLPSISIFSPENKTYSTNAIPLTFAIDEIGPWIGYSLDRQTNITIPGDTMLSGLSDRMHTIVVYASDIAGNIGSSDMVLFSVDTTPPGISILSPENKTYYGNDIPLTFAVDESVSWISYSLGGQTNETITGNTTLTGLSDGSHSLMIYAKDIVGNLGASERVYFSISLKQETPTTFPFEWIIAIAALGIVGLAAGFLLNRKRSGREDTSLPRKTKIERPTRQGRTASRIGWKTNYMSTPR